MRDFCDTAVSLQRQSFQNDPQRFAASDFLARGICGLIKEMSRAVPNLVLIFPFLKGEVAKPKLLQDHMRSDKEPTVYYWGRRVS